MHQHLSLSQNPKSLSAKPTRERERKKDRKKEKKRERSNFDSSFLTFPPIRSTAVSSSSSSSSHQKVKTATGYHNAHTRSTGSSALPSRPISCGVDRHLLTTCNPTNQGESLSQSPAGQENDMLEMLDKKSQRHRDESMLQSMTLGVKTKLH